MDFISYTLFHQQNAGYSENEKIFLCINNFPSEDPIEILGYGINTEIIYNFRRSNKFLTQLNVFEKIQE